jgi:hypothetical protein
LQQNVIGLNEGLMVAAGVANGSETEGLLRDQLLYII